MATEKTNCLTDLSEQAVVFLMGATACGKTALSLQLARTLDAEIISVDSALVYRGLDIGTAKPSATQLATIPHHLIDICDPWDAYSAARFASDAQRLIDDIQSRGKRPLLVGGTMLYYRALEQGIAPLPEADALVRQALMEEATEHGWEYLHKQLSQVDPGAAARIHPNDPQRLQRALEVYRLTGIPMSLLQQHTHTTLSKPPLKFALIPEDRAWLHQRIEQRFNLMLKEGFLEEVRQLRANPRIHAELPSMRSVGYRQAWDYLDSVPVESDAVFGGSIAAQAWVEQAVIATRQLAKRQLTWLRGMKEVNLLSCDTLSVEEQHDMICKTITDRCQETTMHE